MKPCPNLSQYQRLSKSQVIKPPDTVSAARPPCGCVLTYRKQKLVCTYFSALKLDCAKSQRSQSSLSRDYKLCSPLCILAAPMSMLSGAAGDAEIAGIFTPSGAQMLPLLCRSFMSITDSSRRPCSREGGVRSNPFSGSSCHQLRQHHHRSNHHCSCGLEKKLEVSSLRDRH